MATTYTVLPEDMDPEKRLRHEWAESLREHMALHGDMTVKELRRRLAALGIDVSRQGIESWLRGTTSPRPHHQSALGTVFNVPVHRLFPIPNLPKSAAS